MDVRSYLRISLLDFLCMPAKVMRGQPHLPELTQALMSPRQLIMLNYEWSSKRVL